MPRLFGTDGVRGLANRDVTPGLALSLAQAAAIVLGEGPRNAGRRPPRLDGLRVVLDCANGAAAGVSPEVFSVAGAQVMVIGNDPDGLNINDGVGSTHLGALSRAVIELGADAGIAHDGDADRCLAVDAAGNPVSGDQIMAILAMGMKER